MVGDIELSIIILLSLSARLFLTVSTIRLHLIESVCSGIVIEISTCTSFVSKFYRPDVSHVGVDAVKNDLHRYGENVCD